MCDCYLCCVFICDRLTGIPGETRGTGPANEPISDSAVPIARTPNYDVAPLGFAPNSSVSIRGYPSAVSSRQLLRLGHRALYNIRTPASLHDRVSPSRPFEISMHIHCIPRYTTLYEVHKVQINDGRLKTHGACSKRRLRFIVRGLHCSSQNLTLPHIVCYFVKLRFS